MTDGGSSPYRAYGNGVYPNVLANLSGPKWAITVAQLAAWFQCIISTQVNTAIVAVAASISTYRSACAAILTGQAADHVMFAFADLCCACVRGIGYQGACLTTAANTCLLVRCKHCTYQSSALELNNRAT